MNIEFEDFEPNTNWCNGVAGDYTFEAKLFNEGSNFGINKGRVSILSICSENKEIVHYSRGWDIEPAEEHKEVFEAILNFLENAPKRFE